MAPRAKGKRREQTYASIPAQESSEEETLELASGETNLGNNSNTIGEKYKGDNNGYASIASSTAGGQQGEGVGEGRVNEIAPQIDSDISVDSLRRLSVTRRHIILALACNASFTDVLVYGVVIPLLPLYAEEHDLSPSQLGAFVATLPIFALLVTFPVAHYARRVPYRTILVASQVLLGTATLMFGLLRSSLFALVIARCAQGASGGMTWISTFAIAGDLFTDPRREDEEGGEEGVTERTGGNKRHSKTSTSTTIQGYTDSSRPSSYSGDGCVEMTSLTAIRTIDSGMASVGAPETTTTTTTTTTTAAASGSGVSTTTTGDVNGSIPGIESDVVSSQGHGHVATTGQNSSSSSSSSSSIHDSGAVSLSTATGLLMGATSIGFMLGPIIGGGLRDWIGPIAPFTLAACIAFATALLLYIKVPNNKPAGEETTVSQLEVLRFLLLSRSSFLSLLTSFIEASAMTLLEPMLALLLSQKFHSRPFQTALMFSVITVSYTVCASLAGRFVARWGHMKTMGIGVAILGCSLPVIPAPDSLWWVGLALLGIGAGAAITVTPAMPLTTQVMTDAGANDFGLIGSIFNVNYTLGMILGPIFGGVLTDFFGIEVPFVVAGLFILLLVPFLIIRRINVLVCATRSQQAKDRLSRVLAQSQS